MNRTKTLSNGQPFAQIANNPDQTNKILNQATETIYHRSIMVLLSLPFPILSTFPPFLYFSPILNFLSLQNSLVILNVLSPCHLLNIVSMGFAMVIFFNLFRTFALSAYMNNAKRIQTQSQVRKDIINWSVVSNRGVRIAPP